MAISAPIFRRMFGHPQGVPGKLGGFIMARANRGCAAWVISRLNVQRTDKVLEIGFGPGVGIELLAGRASAGRVSGIEASPVMIEQATARNREAISTRRVQLQQGFADRLPFPDASFDKALAINSMQFWPDAVAALREIGRVLKVSGRIAVAFTPRSGQPNSGISEALIAAGFMAPEQAERRREFSWFATKP